MGANSAILKIIKDNNSYIVLIYLGRIIDFYKNVFQRF